MKKGWLFAEGVIVAVFLVLDLIGRGAEASLVKYVGIVLCFLTALSSVIQKKLEALEDHARIPNDALAMLAALFFTVLADTFLILLDSNYALGVFFFCLVQSLYAKVIGLDRKTVMIRLLTMLLLLAVLASVGKWSLLAALSAYSMSQLILNVFFSFRRKSVSRRMAVALALFLACDVCVGIRNLPAFFPAFPQNLALAASLLIWVFYLPSQVALTEEFTAKINEKKEN